VIRALLSAHTCNVLVVLALWFTAPGVFDPGFVHQVAFIRCIDEYRRTKYSTVGQRDGDDVSIVHGDAMPLFQAGMRDLNDLCFFQHFEEDLLRNVRFEVPLDGFVVVLAYPLEELARHATDDSILAAIRRTEPACNHTAEMLVCTDQRDRHTLPRCRDSRDDAACRCAVDHHVKLSGLRCPKIYAYGRGEKQGGDTLLPMHFDLSFRSKRRRSQQGP